MVPHAWFRAALASDRSSFQDPCALSRVTQLSPTFSWILNLKFSGLKMGLPLRSSKPVMVAVYIVMFHITKPQDIGTVAPVVMLSVIATCLKL